MKLQGQSIVITGAGRGFGEQMALAAAAEGASLVVGDIDGDEAERVAAAIRDGGGSAAAVTVDVTEETSAQAMVEACLEKFGKLDVLVNNAGVAGPMGLISEIKAEAWDAVFEVNLRGYFLCAKWA